MVLEQALSERAVSARRLRIDVGRRRIVRGLGGLSNVLAVGVAAASVVAIGAAAGTIGALRKELRLTL